MTTLDRLRPQTVHVPLGDRAYDVLIGEGLVANAGPIIAERLGRRRALVVTDEVVAALHLPALTASLDTAGIGSTAIVLPEGEATKSPARLMETVDAILDAGLERGDLVIALGGGVIGDLAGFAAAVARRGMPFVQVPTTLLAQVDSSVGGKTGINTRHGKNLVGAFHQPALVLSDLGVLATLSERHRKAGYAEIVKIGLLGDAAFFDRLEALGPRVFGDGLQEAVATAVAAKAEVVVADEREAGRRALLNLGHTFAHAVERCAGYDGRVVHGEAVGLGLALAFRFSQTLGLCPGQDTVRVERHLAAVGLPTTFDQLPVALDAPSLIAAMGQDKKVKDGVVRFILLNRIGDAFVSEGVPPEALRTFLHHEGLPTP
ncbi:3-dehydroquinate synthase [Acuticoccus sp. I52.16.1]|uniref:3-dehydroquinate synthase n=1 Tax=Acuticoccus sp. I52.16.1 TaxID=2928472 RepID=UPI001FD383D9|nr:3-dehydroquinate synthase [Acuticoccus sp. I52.16.1]UOM33635.1 3-dehydroquinate synthase [Acuticoccus sp. I52.16.1]